MSYKDPTGLWVETALDIAGIVWDIAEIGMAIKNKDTKGIVVNSAALVVDIAFAILPVATGGGTAVRAGVKTIDKVIDGAKKVDKVADTVRCLKRVDDITGGICFTAHTLIKTEDGFKAIKNIKLNDKVFSKNIKTGKISLKLVKNVFVRQSNKLVYIHLTDQKIETTEEHPFWIEGKGWISAKDLTENDSLLSVDNETIGIQRVELVELRTPQDVYNFEVEDWHTYFVGDHAVLVHNTCKKGNQGKYSPDRKLPREKHGDPIPDTNVPHTQLGKNRNGENSAREWSYDNNGNITATKRIDFTASVPFAILGTLVEVSSCSISITPRHPVGIFMFSYNGK